LASPFELIAHNREPDKIAKNIGADSVVYQSLDDLIGACASLSTYQNPETKDNEPSKFEVGVFCGTYITPVGDGYFEHLEKVRGEGRKLKAMKGAREAVLSGVAGKEEIDMAVNGVAVDGQGKLVAAEHDDSDANGYGSKRTSLASHADAESPTVRDRMDISLHNLGDYNQD
jgi:amidophosphoribosyltransferase